MTARPVALFAGVVITIAGCAGESPVPASKSPRLTILERAFATRNRDPAGAAELFAAAGPGTHLERARIAAWLEVLERADDDPNRWRSFLAAEPGEPAAGIATLALADALAASSDPDAAVAVLVNAPPSVRTEADLRVLGLGDSEDIRAATRRLAVDAPARLRDHSRSLERAAFDELDHEARMQRAAAWRRSGLGSQGAAELRGIRSRGFEEVARRLELARCELDAGSSTRVLDAIGPLGDASWEASVLRAEAERLRAWSRVPGRGPKRFFSRCVAAARRAVDLTGDRPPTRALELLVECGTEAGDLDAAVTAWRGLESSGWIDGRRSWLGRRLGVALARAGAPDVLVDELGGALPAHERCLRFWSSRDDAEELEALAGAPLADLYARWARVRIDAVPASRTPVGRQPAGTAAPPDSVAWLLDHGSVAESSDEWQRLIRERRPTVSEALAAAELADRAGHANAAIRTVLRAVPDLGSQAIADAPVDLVRTYLPLRWSDELAAAARDTGLEPWLIAAVARQESTFTARARSSAGALGVLQLLPSTARGHARAVGLGSRPDLADPAVNIRLGARELARLVRRFGELEPALAAYNAGENRVRRWWRHWPERELFSESIPIPETYTYVRRVVFLADAYRQVHVDTWSITP